jgi:hypothetical protein
MRHNWSFSVSVPTILAPLFAQVLLTLGLLLWLGAKRRRDFEAGSVKPADIALREPNWPGHTQQVAYAFSNQFELPVLFYVLTILAMMTRHADLLFVVLAWIFVLCRFIHAFEHTTSNVVIRRGGWYAVGAVVLIAMWVIFIVRIMLGLP